MTCREAMRRAERAYWLAMLEEHRWNYSHACKAAGVCRQHVYATLKRLGISRPVPVSH